MYVVDHTRTIADAARTWRDAYEDAQGHQLARQKPLTPDELQARQDRLDDAANALAAAVDAERQETAEP